MGFAKTPEYKELNSTKKKNHPELKRSLSNNRRSSLRTPTNKLVLSLIVSDSIMMTKSWILVINAMAGGPIMGNTGEECISARRLFWFISNNLTCVHLGCGSALQETYLDEPSVIYAS